MSSFTNLLDLAARDGRPVVFFDFETTGTPTKNNGSLDWSAVRPVEVAMVCFFPGAPPIPSEAAATVWAALSEPDTTCGPPGNYHHGLFLVHHMRINPGIPIPAEATAVHGISDADVVSAPAWDSPEVVKIFRDADEAGAIFVGHNIAGFDLPLAVHLGYLSEIPIDSANNPRYIDTLNYFRSRQSRESWPTTEPPDVGWGCPAEDLGLDVFRSNLSAAHAALCGWLFGGAHSALEDVVANVRVCGRLIDMWCAEETTAALLAVPDNAVEYTLSAWLGALDQPPKGVTGHDEMIAVAIDGYVVKRGKAAGTRLDMIGADDLRWLAGLGDLDRRTAGVIAAEMARRGVTIRRLIGGDRWLAEEQSGAVVIARGKHADTPITEVDGGYLTWMLGLGDLNPETRTLLTAERARRE